MAIADIITGGFGTFSSVNMIPTKGFTIGTDTNDYSPPWKHIYVISHVRMTQQVKLVLKHI